MRYIPNLIPHKSRVLEDYFKASPYHPKKKNTFLEIISWLFGIMFLLNALVRINHPVLSIILGILGFILIPPGHIWIEKKLRFRFTTKIKAFAGIALFIIAIPLTNHYNEIDRINNEKIQLLAQKEEAKKKAEQIAERKRKDSLDFYLTRSRLALKKNLVIQGDAALDQAAQFTFTEEDRKILEDERINIAALKTRQLITAGKYKQALITLDDLLAKSPGNGNLLYSRALCYSKTGRITDAVTDCKKALELGNEQANKLHEKINPIKKRVAYYVTRCCDGTTSSATGRGACSHHGGVCDWNDPVYEEYRKYE